VSDLRGLKRFYKVVVVAVMLRNGWTTIGKSLAVRSIGLRHQVTTDSATK
jgi:hypothetical protein